MKIQVTKDHIEKGRGSCSTQCPIALAMKEQVPRINNITVWYDKIGWLQKRRNHFLYFNLSTKIQDWIKRFDSWYDKDIGSKKPRSFTFDFKIPK